MAQQVLFDEHTASLLREVLAQHGIENPFIIRGRHAGIQETAEQLFTFNHHCYLKEDTEVTTGEVAQCHNLFRSVGGDAVVAIGGGRVIDLAKAMIYTHRMNNQPPFRAFIAMPTTAGSGSEATQFAVVYNDKVKTSLDESFLLPDIAMLDPVLTYSLPSIQTAVSGMDALAQAIESYWNIRADAVSIPLAASAIHILLSNLPEAVRFPGKANRKNMLWGAHLAGKSINITRTTGPHALSYFLTAHYDIPHGQAVAFFLPLFFIYNANVHPGNCNHPNGPGKVHQRLNEIYSFLNVKNEREAMEYMRSYIKNLGLATTLAEYGIDKTSIVDSLLQGVNQQRFNNNPVSLDLMALKKICLEFL